LIDIDAFSSALSAGDLDACLELLRSCDSGGSTFAVLNCRAAETLFHNGRRNEAVDAAAAPLPWRRTIPRRPISAPGCSAIAAATRRRPPPMNGCSNDRPIGPTAIAI
jgi:hypothetical protein